MTDILFGSLGFLCLQQTQADKCLLFLPLVSWHYPENEDTQNVTVEKTVLNLGSPFFLFALMGRSDGIFTFITGLDPEAFFLK